MGGFNGGSVHTGQLFYQGEDIAGEIGLVFRNLGIVYLQTGQIGNVTNLLLVPEPCAYSVIMPVRKRLRVA